MYNEFEEYDLKTKLNYKIWIRILKEMLRYPWYLIGAIVSMIGAAFFETMFIKYICTDGLQTFLSEGINDNFWFFVVFLMFFVMMFVMFFVSVIVGF